MVAIERAFARIREGQVHLRRRQPAHAGQHIPLVLLHSSPVASGSLVPLMQALGNERLLIAPDTLGNGDSASPKSPNADLGYFADATVRLLQTLELEQVDLYGVRTGALIAAEIAVSRPVRVRRLILDEVNLPPEGFMESALETNSPQIEPDDMGRHLLWAWNVMRDHSLFYPWFARDREHRLNIDLPSAGAIHDSTVEVLKALRTFHVSYRAAFRYPRRARLPLITVPTLILADPAHLASKKAPDVTRLISTAVLRRLPRGANPISARTNAINQYLSGSVRMKSKKGDG